jgi:hypothetical protein
MVVQWFLCNPYAGNLNPRVVRTILAKYGAVFSIKTVITVRYHDYHHYTVMYSISALRSFTSALRCGSFLLPTPRSFPLRGPYYRVIRTTPLSKYSRDDREGLVYCVVTNTGGCHVFLVRVVMTSDSPVTIMYLLSALTLKLEIGFMCSTRIFVYMLCTNFCLCVVHEFLFVLYTTFCLRVVHDVLFMCYTRRFVCVLYTNFCLYVMHEFLFICYARIFVCVVHEFLFVFYATFCLCVVHDFLFPKNRLAILLETEVSYVR